MIGFLRGNLISKRPPSLTLDVGGVGYELEAPMSTFYRLPDVGSPLSLVTHISPAEAGWRVHYDRLIGGRREPSEATARRVVLAAGSLGVKG